MTRVFTRARLIATFVAILSLAAPGIAGAQAPLPSTTVISVDSWISRLQAAEQIAQQGMLNPSRAQMETLISTLDLPATVRTPSGTTIVISDPFFEGAGQGSIGDFSDAQTHLDAMMTAATQSAALPPIDRAALQSNLEKAFNGLHPGSSTVSQTVTDLRLAAGNFVAQILGDLFSNHGAVTVFGWLLVLVAAGAIFLIARRLRLSLVPHKTTEGEDGRRMTRTDWRALAESALGRGDFREAARCLYHALLVEFADAGVVTDDPAITAGELRKAVSKARPELYSDVITATNTFERAHFGETTPDYAAVAHMREVEKKVRA